MKIIFILQNTDSLQSPKFQRFDLKNYITNIPNFQNRNGQIFYKVFIKIFNRHFDQYYTLFSLPLGVTRKKGIKYKLDFCLDLPVKVLLMP